MKLTFAASLTSRPRPPQSRRTRRTAESARQGRTRRLERERAPGAPAPVPVLQRIVRASVEQDAR